MTEEPREPVQENPKTRRVTAGLPVAVALVLLVLVAYALLSPDKLASRPHPGDPAPEFTLTTFEGAQIALQDLRGHVVVLNFWASWCAPCRREATGLQETWRRYQDRGVILLGITYQDAEDASLDFMREFGVTYPNGTDPLGHIGSAYGVTAVPETYVIGPDGRVAWVRIGEIGADELAKQLDRLVGGPAVKSPDTLMEEIDVVAQSLRDELVAGAPSESKALSTARQLGPDGRWPDLDYGDRARTDWSPGEHVVRLAQLAAAYRAHLYAPDEADELERAILAALTFWVKRDPQSDNGWFNSIHTPKYLSQTLLLMGDTVPESIWEQAVAIVRRSGFTHTGANPT